MEETLQSIDNYIENHNIEYLHINFLGDELHSCKVGNSVTESGTQLDHVDTRKALKDFNKFINSLISITEKRVGHLTINRVPGNHDRSISAGVLTALESHVKNITLNINYNEQRFCYTIGKVAIMITHGDKGNLKNLSKTLFAEIQKLKEEEKKVFDKCKSHIVLVGHKHTELVKQDELATVYQVGTNKAADSWENNNGFIKNPNVRNWQIMSFNETRLLGYEYI
jgi:hypothetical protein